MEEKITLKGLSKLLDLSPSTISKSLNDSKEISTETKERVKKMATLNNYVPNTYAQNLRSKRGRTIGVIIPTIREQFFSLALESMLCRAKEMSYKVITCISYDSIKKEKENIKFLLQNQVEGIAMSLSKETQTSLDLDHLRRLKELKVPLVLFNEIVNHLDCDKIGIDEYKGAKKATQNLMKAGRKKLLYISGLPGTYNNERRKNGYFSAIAKSDIKRYILEYNYTDYPKDKLKLILRKYKLDGILASDELTAARTMKNIQKWGYNIPEDIAIIGFSNGITGEEYYPSLTIIDQNASEQGNLAISTLIKRLENRFVGGFISHNFQTLIIHRESTTNFSK